MQCEICGGLDMAPSFEGIDLLMDVPGKFAVSRCSSCGSYGQDPTPGEDALLHLYPEEYGPYQRGGLGTRIAKGNGLRRRVQHVMSVRKKVGTLLDVGCASGLFLDRMVKLGWDVSGVELNPRMAQRARDELGLTIFTGILEAARLPAQTYDVVTLWDVLEHVRSPRQTLREAARILRPGGWLVFRVPNPESLSARIFGRMWFGWELPRHLWVAPRAAMIRALLQAGLCLNRTSASSGRFAVLHGSIRNIVNERMGHTRLARVAVWLGGSAPARVLTAPYFAVSGALGQGSLLTYYSQKVT